MSDFGFASFLLVVTSLFGFINARLLKLPNTIGLLLIALATSLAIIGGDRLMGSGALRAEAQRLFTTVDLPRTLLDGALAFLLFAGSLHVDLTELWNRKWTVLALATAGVLIATALFGIAIHGIFGHLGMAVPLSWCAVLGAILAPTDPIAIGDLLRRVGLPASLQATVAGESLFNDGVGVVVFSIALGVATGADGMAGTAGIVVQFLIQAAGGAALGLATGYLAYWMIKQIDDSTLEIMISLALAMGTYSLASRIGVSGPIAVVVAGILIGSHAVHQAMSEVTRHHLVTFWSLVDELLNAVLFLLIGFSVLAVPLGGDLIAAAIAVPLALAVRLISVVVPIPLLHLRTAHRFATIGVLTWGGLRGGISVALALALPPSPYRGAMLAVCYAVVVFTIVVQGLTMNRMLRILYPAAKADSDVDHARA